MGFPENSPYWMDIRLKKPQTRDDMVKTVRAIDKVSTTYMSKHNENLLKNSTGWFCRNV